jgi:UDP-GlcNAc:undecaprenyl-phosphate GlcNAc-1-phosphate transferase
MVYLVTFFVSFICSLILTRFFIFIGQRYDITDYSWGRKIHQGKAVRLGGLSLVISIFICLSFMIKGNFIYSKVLLIILSGGILSLALGLVDDIRRLDARYKLLFQVMIAVGSYLCGIQIRVVNIPFIGLAQMGVFSLPITIIWIVGIMNAINMIDGLNGLCGGVTFIVMGVIFILSFVFGKVFVSLLCVALAGATLGFLWYNFRGKPIFLGDSGAYLLGYMLATLSIISGAKGNILMTIIAPLFSLSLPILDMSLAIWRRTRDKRHPFLPDRAHIHHILLALGWSPKKAVLALWALTFFFALNSLIIVFGQRLEMGLASLLILSMVIWFIRYLNIKRTTILSSKENQVEDNLLEFHKRLLEVKSFDNFSNTINEFIKKIDFYKIEFILDNKRPLIWVNGKEEEDQKRPFVETSYPIYISNEKGVIRFQWVSELGFVSPHMDWLLKMSSKMIKEALERNEVFKHR